MDLDLLNVSFDLNVFTPGELEEVLEDPYSIRILPEVEHGEANSRYYAIGKTLRARALFLCFKANGKQIRIIAVREASAVEEAYYERNLAEI